MRRRSWSFKDRLPMYTMKSSHNTPKRDGRLFPGTTRSSILLEGPAASEMRVDARFNDALLSLLPRSSTAREDSRDCFIDETCLILASTHHSLSNSTLSAAIVQSSSASTCS